MLRSVFMNRFLVNLTLKLNLLKVVKLITRISVVKNFGIFTCGWDDCLKVDALK